MLDSTIWRKDVMETDRQIDRQTDRQTDRTDTQTDRQTDRQTDAISVPHAAHTDICLRTYVLRTGNS